MLVRKNVTLKGIWEFAGHHFWWLISYMVLIVVLYRYVGWQWVSIPWLPVSLIGTAVAFYVGFKNNQAYDRIWEARRIWGSIVNSSRSWGAMVNAYVRSDELMQRNYILFEPNSSTDISPGYIPYVNNYW